MLIEFVGKDHGLGYAHLNDDVIRLMHSEDGKTAMENTANWFQAIRTGLRLFPKIGPMQRRQIRDIWASTQACQPDLILFHPKAFGAAHFAERLKIPCIFAFYLPMYSPTGEFPAMGLPALPWGRWWPADSSPARLQRLGDPSACGLAGNREGVGILVP